MKKNLNSDSYRKWSGIIVFVFLLAGCASTAHIEKDDNADFSRYKSFAWIDKDGEGRNDGNKNNDLTELKIREAVNKELERSAGWKEVRNRPLNNMKLHERVMFKQLKSSILV